MQEMLRVFRGIWPYRWRFVLSLLCALGTSLSYAFGVATIFPITKTFVSLEGVHGWVDQKIVDDRFNISTLDMDSSLRDGQLSVVVTQTGSTDSSTPIKISAGDQINQVWLVGPDGRILQKSDSWQGMMSLLAGAPANTNFQLMLQPGSGRSATRLDVTTPPLSLLDRLMLAGANKLPQDPMMSLLTVFGALVVLCIVGSTFRYFQGYLSGTLAAKMIIDLRRRMYEKVMLLPISHFNKRGTSQLVSNMVQDTYYLSNGLTILLGRTILEPAKAIAVAIMAIWVDWKLFLATVVLFPIIGFIIYKFSRMMRSAASRSLKQSSTLMETIDEALTGLKIVKTYNSEGYERRRFAAVNKDYYKLQSRMIHYTSISKPIIELAAIVLISIPILVTANFVLHNSISRESFFLMLASLVAIFEPLRKLGDLNTNFQMTRSAAERIFTVIDMEPEPNALAKLPKIAPHAKSIEFENVSFTYPESRHPAIQNISFTVTYGEKIAIVGANGSGKTTLLALLPRLYVPSKGRILIDGVDAATVSLKSLRRQISLVTQDTILFNDTLYNNIAYGSRHAEPGRVMDASRRSYTDEFARIMPDGYQTRIGPSGVRLSGGQRQRIAIARAILRDTPIFILDEAMSQIDSNSEAKISSALEEFMLGRTTFVIAHRFTTILSAELIICLKNGSIAGMGTHEYLEQNCPTYRQLYETQLLDRNRKPPKELVVK
ncbi:MAG TPA: ABC transporter ATP-binding protein [Phycisphaerae bacterium]|nr:ABC transporter ATP-binding protein [Phycisphaerae bacterium]